MDIEKVLSDAAVWSGCTEWGIIQTANLRFYPEVRRICEGNACCNYSKTWACPPAVGSLEECRQRVIKYESMFLFSRRFVLEDSFDLEGMEKGVYSFKTTVDALTDMIKPVLDDALILSNEGCKRCVVCTYPYAPCRFPDKLYPSIEGFGFIVSELAQQAGIKYNNGPNTVTFFGAVLFNSLKLLRKI